MQSNHDVTSEILKITGKHPCLSAGIVLSVSGAVVFSLLPPLVLGNVIDRLTEGQELSITLIIVYFGLIALTGGLESVRESLLIVFGQKITHALRSRLCDKLTHLSADSVNKQEPGVVASRFVSDVNTVEDLFTSGIISMFADACKIISILIIITIKNKGLAVILLLTMPIIFLFTRMVQKKMLAAQYENRVAVSRVTNHVPESMRCIRTIHTLGKENYMEDRYDKYIEESYAAVDKTNFYDAIYSPVILILNALIVAVVMLLSASGNAKILIIFGMSAGTAVAVMNYISQIFSPIQSLGMEIQTIQSAIAGVRRINEFLSLPEKWETEEELSFRKELPCMELKEVVFGYDEHTVLDHVGFAVKTSEQVTLAGRTGAGKSTIFKLLLGLYRPVEGEVLIYGMKAEKIPDAKKRQIFGYVEQNLKLVPGTVRDQITLFDQQISEEMVQNAAKMVGLHESILNLEKEYDTICTSGIFSQGQWQLLAIARAVAAEPKILLLDEITANLDADTEQTVLEAIRHAAEGRTVLSISHRIYEHTGGRMIEI